MNSIKKSLNWIAFVICFAGIPGLLLFLGLTHTQRQNSINRLETHRLDLSRFYKSIRKFADPQHFWCTTLMEVLAPDTIIASEAAPTIIARVGQLRQNLKFNYVVYTPKAGVLSASMPLKPTNDWKLALHTAWKAISPGGFNLSDEDQVAGGKIFGPQLNWSHFNNSTRVDSLALVWADSSLKKPVVWGRIIHQHLVLVFIEIQDLYSDEGIWNLLKDFSQKSGDICRFSLRNNAGNFRHGTPSANLISQIEKAANEYEREKTQQISSPDLVIFPFFLRPGVTIFGYFEHAAISG